MILMNVSFAIIGIGKTGKKIIDNFKNSNVKLNLKIDFFSFDEIISNNINVLKNINFVFICGDLKNIDIEKLNTLKKFKNSKTNIFVSISDYYSKILDDFSNTFLLVNKNKIQDSILNIFHFFEKPGYYGLDFKDLFNLFRESNFSIMNSGYSYNSKKAIISTLNELNIYYDSNIKYSKPKGILLDVIGDKNFNMTDFEEMIKIIKDFFIDLKDDSIIKHPIIDPTINYTKVNLIVFGLKVFKRI